MNGEAVSQTEKVGGTHSNLAFTAEAPELSSIVTSFLVIPGNPVTHTQWGPRVQLEAWTGRVLLFPGDKTSKKPVYHSKPRIFMSAGVLDDVYLLENQVSKHFL